MYITIKNLNKNLGKFIELDDLLIGLPLFLLFLTLFSINSTRYFSLVILAVSMFLLVPVNISNKNRMYKLLILIIRYLFSIKMYFKNSNLKGECFFNEVIKKIQKL